MTDSFIEMGNRAIRPPCAAARPPLGAGTRGATAGAAYARRSVHCSRFAATPQKAGAWPRAVAAATPAPGNPSLAARGTVAPGHAAGPEGQKLWRMPSIAAVVPTPGATGWP
ncbi:hypothetical protein LIG30_0467 [Burkholderia sp. lig30]|nr:hypothetical protein LIG30_0467 [Burkholderia sp. lig30]